MRQLRAWLVRLNGLFLKQRRDGEFSAELESHLQMHVEDNLRAGMNPQEARREALMKLGGVEQTKEKYRDRRGLPALEVLLQDLRFGLRMLRKNPGFTAVAILTLALGIGSTTAIFSVVYGVLLRPLPYQNSDQIVRMWEVDATGHHMNFADPNFADIRAQSHSLQGVAEFNAWLAPVSGGVQPTRAMVAFTSSEFFSVMGVQPIMGRGFAPEDQRFGAAPVVLVGYGYWKESLGAPADLSRIKLVVENRPATVVGVLPPGFNFPEDAQMWVPRELYEQLPSRTAHNWEVIARLRENAPLSQAHVELSTIAHRLKQQYGEGTMMTDVAVIPLQVALTKSMRPALLILLGAVAFLLLIACANVANLMLAQAATRERELAIRAALGAARGRLVRQFLTEALLLSLSGGALGVLAAIWGMQGLHALAPSDLPRLNDVSVGPPVLLFTLGIVLLVAVGLGTSSALRATSGDVQLPLAEQGRSQTGTLRSQRLGRVIAAAQLAITLVLLVGAGLLGRSLLHVLSVNPGFRTERIVAMDLALSYAEQDADKIRRVQFLNALLERLRAIPGVDDVGGTAGLPLAGGTPSNGTYVLMAPGDSAPRSLPDIEKLFRSATRTGQADYCPASEGSFRVLGIPLLRGRLFEDRDTMDAPHVALISESLAREKWPNADPVDEKIEFGNIEGDTRLLTVIGVVGDIRSDSLETPPRPTIYVNFRQRPQHTQRFTALIRTSSEPSSLFPPAREIVRHLDPNVPPSFHTLGEIYSASLKSRRFNLLLVAVFAGAALLLAVAGIYGVMAYSVERRASEIGVRMALGASPGDVLRMILGQGLSTILVGLACGALGAYALTRTMESLLFGLSATDPLTFLAVALLLASVTLVACYIPARRATRVDPMIALRYE
jgi:putative ABC transport system permease protein